MKLCQLGNEKKKIMIVPDGPQKLTGPLGIALPPISEALLTPEPLTIKCPETSDNLYFINHI